MEDTAENIYTGETLTSHSLRKRIQCPQCKTPCRPYRHQRDNDYHVGFMCPNCNVLRDHLSTQRWTSYGDNGRIGMILIGVLRYHIALEYERVSAYYEILRGYGLYTSRVALIKADSNLFEKYDSLGKDEMRTALLNEYRKHKTLFGITVEYFIKVHKKIRSQGGD